MATAGSIHTRAAGTGLIYQFWIFGWVELIVSNNFVICLLLSVDVEECASSPCVNGDCNNGMNFYTCDCHVGWSGTNCDTACEENPCNNGGTCVQIDAATLECQCPFPFNGTFCEISKWTKLCFLLSFLNRYIMSNTWNWTTTWNRWKHNFE